MLEYNSLTAIDELINQLEIDLPNLTENSEVNKMLEERKEKIKRLKELQQIAKEEEREMLEKLKEENASIDEAIDGLKTLIKKKTYRPKRKKATTTEYQSYGSESASSESRSDNSWSISRTGSAGFSDYGSESAPSESRSDNGWSKLRIDSPGFSDYGSESASSESRW